MKKYEELSREEKKVLQTEFKVSDFGKYFKLMSIYEVVTIVYFILVFFTNFFENTSIFVDIIILVLFIGFGEFIAYKKKKLVKSYYELKNNK